MVKNIIETWRSIIITEDSSWVIFEHGTCIVFKSPDPPLNLKKEAIDLLKKWGPVVPGTPSGDFNIISLEQQSGWVITCHHPDIINYVDRSEFDEFQLVGEVNIGLLGRSKRDADAKSLKVIHIEKK
ncbi:MAG: hypothetical protein EAX96_19855 [Candidatus Lokiarchaeota archaeon]|nr:hypothetical protein [Candidatus Lokiarchaeota archaeon]